MGFGTFSTSIIIDCSWCIQLPKSMDIAHTAPLMTSGLSAFSFLKQLRMEKGQHLAVYGLGGIGQILAKYAAAMDIDVTVFTRHAANKRSWAEKHKFQCKDVDEIKVNHKKFDVVALCCR